MLALGACWKRFGIIRQAMQIVDDVGPFGGIGLARKGHFRALGVSLGIGEELVEIVIGPFAALGLDGLGIVEARDRGFRPVDDTIERRPDLDRRRLSRNYGKLGRALCPPRLFSHRPAAKRCPIGRDGWRGAAPLPPAAVSGAAGQRIARLDELGMCENPAGDHIQPHRKEKRSEKRASDFVQFESIQGGPPSPHESMPSRRRLERAAFRHES